MVLHPDLLLRVLPEYRDDFHWRDPLPNAAPVTLGQWHQIEWYASASTGALRWWLDGVLYGSHDDVFSRDETGNLVPFDMFQFSPTFGGNSGAVKQQFDHYGFDHVRVSIR
jgi:hypothetical protein